MKSSNPANAKPSFLSNRQGGVDNRVNGSQYCSGTRRSFLVVMQVREGKSEAVYQAIVPLFVRLVFFSHTSPFRVSKSVY